MTYDTHHLNSARADLSASTSATGDNDVFHDRGVWLVLVCLAMLVLVSCIGLGVIYYGDSIAVPAWSEHSMPALRPA